MDESPHLCFSDAGDGEDVEGEDTYQEERDVALDAMKSTFPDLQKHQESDKDWNSFPCPHCERHFSSKAGLERHMHIHTAANSDTLRGSRSSAFGSSVGHIEKMRLFESERSSPSSSNTSALLGGDQDGLHPCKYCDKIFTTHTNKRRHERRIHEQQLQLLRAEKGDHPQRTHTETSAHTQAGVSTTPAALPENKGEQYMLDVSSNISENLSFYIDGKIVSTSTVSSCEAAEVHSGSLVRLDSLILHPAQISQVLNTESELPGQPLARRRTATPPLLPQIKTELESEVVVSSSSSSLVSSLIENLLPQNIESTVVQKERTVFLSPKLKQLLEKQDGLKPTLALITDGQTSCSPVSLSVLPAGTGRFKRRTGSPPSSPQEETADSADYEASNTGHMETQHSSSPVLQVSDVQDDVAAAAEDPAVKPETWPPHTGGNSCNQQPLDLSNAVRRTGDAVSSDAALDLSLQKKILTESDLRINVVPQVLQEPSRSVPEAVMNPADLSLCSSEPPPLVSDFTIVTGADMMTPVDPLPEGLVYGLALPPTPLTAPPSLTPVTSSPCTITFAPPAAHTLLPSAPSLITVLAPPPLSNPSNQQIQVLAPNISPEPLVICTENTLSSSECDLAAAFTATNPANLVTLSQSLDPALNLPGHVFLTDQIALNPPVSEPPPPVADGPFAPTVTVNDPLVNSYNITTNTVLIECTIALEAPEVVSLQENTAEPPEPSQLLLNHIKQQQEHIVSVPTTQTVDPNVVVSSITESVNLSSSSSVTSDGPADGESSPGAGAGAGAGAEAEAGADLDVGPPALKEEEAAVSSAPTSELPPQLSPSPPAVKSEEEELSKGDDAQPQTFTKNFVCNVCDKLFHSMKELGDHVSDHADQWPYKCEFCVLLFEKPPLLLEHRATLHGVATTYVCSACTKEFVYLCNLKQHQEELHPGLQCTYTEEEKGKLRPQNYNNSARVNTEPEPEHEDEKKSNKEEGDVDAAAEELLTTIKIMASDGGRSKGPDVRLGINQHYPSFKPPPFPYHNRSPAGSVASATNFTTHNIPQTFSTAIRCTKCGKSFDNMPELHKHILACANASDKRRYTPKKNPIPLRHFAKTQKRVLSTTNSTNGLNAANKTNRVKPSQEPPVKVKFKAMKRRRKKLVQRVLPPRNKSNKMSPPQPDEQQQPFVCSHCSREFSLRRSRTKHMAVCPRKPKEGRKRKEGGISVTKENLRHLHRGDEQKASLQHKTRLQASGPGKRAANLPVQTVFSSKRSKIVIKESMQPKAELSELPLVRTFSPSIRQYGRVQHSVKGIPIKITIVKPPHRRKDERPRSREDAGDSVSSSSEQNPSI